MIAGIHISQEIFAIGVLQAFKNLFGASSEACSAMVTIVWRPGFSKTSASCVQHMTEWIKEGTSFFKSQNSLLKVDR